MDLDQNCSFTLQNVLCTLQNVLCTLHSMIKRELGTAQFCSRPDDLAPRCSKIVFIYHVDPAVHVLCSS